MKKKTNRKPTRSRFSLLRQLCNLIPNHLVPGLAREYDAEAKSRTFKPWSHVVSLIFAQLTHALGLNDVCDALRLNAGPLSAIRGATPPSKNALSHANRERDAAMAEKLFWNMLAHLQAIAPQFGGGRRPRFAFRFKRMIHVVDSTTIQLVARCMDWAKHRRRKAAAKCHVRLNLQTFLPRFAIVDTAGEHDNRRARELCAGVRAGEIVIFDKAYLDFAHLADLAIREVFWVTRAKDNLEYRVVRKLQRGIIGNILADDLIELTTAKSHHAYPNWMRRVVAWVEVEGERREMVFLTNNLEWSAQTIADLYRCRWSIEVFFKELKQTLQLADFLGHNANAVRWQVWTALLVYLLLRFCAFLSQWGHSFTRLFALLRSALWQKLEVRSLLEVYGTAGGGGRFLGTPQQAYLPGLN
ncbi:MAG TPA: IS4 family transposase [Verrucomicrobiae bacterium]|nr:IS4 family transposase [Verrucomicrobiae bacterium]